MRLHTAPTVMRCYRVSERSDIELLATCCFAILKLFGLESSHCSVTGSFVLSVLWMTEAAAYSRCIVGTLAKSFFV